MPARVPAPLDFLVHGFYGVFFAITGLGRRHPGTFSIERRPNGISPVETLAPMGRAALRRRNLTIIALRSWG